jgi:hypothetical protein
VGKIQKQPEDLSTRVGKSPTPSNATSKTQTANHD